MTPGRYAIYHVSIYGEGRTETTEVHVDKRLAGDKSLASNIVADELSRVATVMAERFGNGKGVTPLVK